MYPVPTLRNGSLVYRQLAVLPAGRDVLALTKVRFPLPELTVRVNGPS